MKKRPTILLIGKDAPLSYLLSRFAERGGYKLAPNLEHLSVEQVAAGNSQVVIFLSTEILEESQALLGKLAALDIPILVCSSIADEVKARNLGADYCLLHPLVYDDFQKVLTDAGSSEKRV